MVPATRLVPLELEIAERLEALVDGMRTEVGLLLSKRGIDQEQWTLLKHVDRAEARAEATDLEALFRRTGMPLDLVLDVLAQLRMRGLVCETEGAWGLTAEGHVLADPIARLEAEVAARMLHGVPHGEIARLQQVLDRLAFNLRQL